MEDYFICLQLDIKLWILNSFHGSGGGTPSRFPSRIFDYLSNRTEDKNLIRFTQTEAHPYPGGELLSSFTITFRVRIMVQFLYRTITPIPTRTASCCLHLRSHLGCELWFSFCTARSRAVQKLNHNSHPKCVSRAVQKLNHNSHPKCDRKNHVRYKN
jgi:hypothetical protein